MYGQSAGAQAAPTQGRLRQEGPSVSDAIKSLDPVLQRFEAYAKRLECIADRVVGPRPSPVADNPAPHADNLVAQLDLRRCCLVGLADWMERLIDTLDGVL